MIFYQVAATVIENTPGELLWRAIKIIPPPDTDQGPDYAQIFADFTNLIPIPGTNKLTADVEVQPECVS